MNIVATDIPNVVIIEPRCFRDERGFFFESFNQRDFEKAIGRNVSFVQDNHSHSIRHVLRGLHYQIDQPQGKLIRVVLGEIFDVAVDLRHSSSTFGRWVGTSLSAENKRQCWIPQGFAHGYLVTSEFADVIYKTTDYWNPQVERAIAWNDPDIGIKWPIVGEPRLSVRDLAAPRFSNAVYAG